MGRPVWESWRKGIDAQRGALAKRLAKAKLAHRADAILATCRVAAGVRIVPFEKKPAALGTTRTGGEADLPAGTKWPKGQTFLMQINLADVAEIPLSSPLPKSGLLSFFVNDDADSDREQLTESTVLYTPAGKPLTRTARPSKDITKIPSRRIDFVPFLHLPQSNSKVVSALKLTDAEGERYADDVYRKTLEPRHRLGGHESDYYAPADAKGKLLLLALKSSDAMSFFWGDADCLHFSLSDADWKKGAFAKASSRCATA